MDDSTKDMVEEAYRETAQEALARGDSSQTAPEEGVVAAAMLLSAMNGVEDEAAKQQVVGLGLKPE